MAYIQSYWQTSTHGIMLRCAFTRGHSGSSRGHFYGIAGMASGKAHGTVYSEGERSLCEVMTTIQATLPEAWLSR